MEDSLIEASFNTAQPDQTMEVNSSLSSSPNNPYVPSIRTGRTIREVSKEIDDLRKENFNLKLRIYFMEEKMAEICGKEPIKNLKVNIDMQIQVKDLQEEIENLQKQLAIKDRMLDECLKNTREKENDLKKASQEIIDLQARAKNIAQDENSDEKYFSPLDSGSESAIYKEAFGIAETPAVKNLASSGRKLAEEFDTLNKELQLAKEQIKALECRNEELTIMGKKKSRSIEALVHKLTKTQSPSDLLGLIEGAVKAAYNGETAQVVTIVDKVKVHLSEILSRPVDEVFRDKPYASPKDKLEVRRSLWKH